MSLPITATFAAILAVYFVAMSSYVIYTRAKTDVLMWDGGNGRMLTAIRRHGNLAEYMPFAILIMAIAEFEGLSTGWLQISGGLLLTGRLIHPFGVAVERSVLPARVTGMLATFVSILIPAIYLLINQFN